MKKTLFALMVACATVFACTPDEKPDNEKDPVENEGGNGNENENQKPEEEKPVAKKPTVSFTDNSYEAGLQYASVMSVVENFVISVTAEIKGEYTTAPAVTVAVDNDYIAQYNASEFTSLVAMPSSLYTVTESPVATEGKTLKFNITYKVPAIMEYMTTNNLTVADLKNYAVALKLVSTDAEIGDDDGMSLGYYLVAPKIIEAYVKTSLTKIDDYNYTFKVALPFENESCTVTYDLEFGKAGYSAPSTARGNYYPARYRCSALPQGAQVTNSSVKSMAPGTSEVEYEITLPNNVAWAKGETLNYLFAVSNVKIDGVDVEAKGDEALVCLPTNHEAKIWRTAGAEAMGDYKPNGFTAEEIALLGHTLDDKGLTVYPKAEDQEYYFHPQNSCQYGGNDMCQGKNSVFSWDHADWGSPWGNNNGTAAMPSYGWGSAIYNADGKGAIWSLIDMNKVQPVEGFEIWRKTGNDYKHTYAYEFYALDACEYTKYKDHLTWAKEDAIYLGAASFDPEETKENQHNVLATTFDRAETQYLMVMMKGCCAGHYAVEFKIFK